MPQPVKIAADTLVPFSSANPETDAHVAASPTGKFAIAWTDDSATADADFINVLRFGEQLSSSSFATDERHASAAYLGDGRTVFAFAHEAAAGDDQIIGNTSTATITGAATTVNGAEAGVQNKPEVVALANGDYAHVWMDHASAKLRGAIYSALGAVAVAPFDIAPNLDPASAHDLGIAALADGGFATAYRNASTGASLVIVSAAGVAGAVVDFDTTITANADSDVAPLADGRVIMVASASTGYRGRVFNADGTPSGASFAIMPSGNSASVAALEDGRFLVVSERSGNIYGQVMRADGIADGAEFQVNAEAGGTQLRPHLATLADGRVVVAWEDGLTGSGDIYYNIWDPREAGLRGGASGLADEWVGTGFTDQVYAAAGNDVINGAGGLDYLYGEAGADTLNGEAGNDRLDGGNHNDILNGGDDIDTAYAGLGNDTVNGDAGDDAFLDGGDGADTVNGGAGNDRVNGGAGTDTLNGDAGADNITGGGGADAINGGGDSDTFLGGDSGIDTINGGLGDDRIDGGAEGDFLHGDDGIDYITAGSGLDFVFGGAGADNLYGGSEADSINGGNDNDVWLGGDAGNDLLNGEQGSDRIHGGADVDTITGGADADVANGGTGADFFVYNFAAEGSVSEQIGDWKDGSDRIRIDASNFGGGLGPGALNANRLVARAAPVADQAFGQFLFDTATGFLSWDVDGTGAGAATTLVKLFTGNFTTPATAIAVGDFEVLS